MLCFSRCVELTFYTMSGLVQADFYASLFGHIQRYCSIAVEPHIQIWQLSFLVIFTMHCSNRCTEVENYLLFIIILRKILENISAYLS